jgi:hypothetical protein
MAKIKGKQIADKTITADKLDPSILSQVSTYIHEQLVPSTTWIIQHNMNSYPTVTVVDSAGTVVVGNVTYDSKNRVTVEFTASFSGSAYLN